MKNGYLQNGLKRGGFIALLLFNLIFGIQGQSYDEIIINLEQDLKEFNLQDTHRVNLLNNLSYAYRRNNPTKIESYAKQALQLSEQLNYDKGKGIAYKNLGIAEYKLSGNKDRIIEFYREAIIWSKKANDHYTHIACLNNLGLCFKSEFAYDKSIEAFQKALSLHDEYLPANRLKLLLLGNIGDTYVTLEDFQNAQQYYDELFEVAKELKDEKTLMIHVETKALLLCKLHKHDEAVQVIEEALPKLKAFGDYQSIVKTQIVYSNILLDQKNFKKAYEVLNDAQSNIQTYNLKAEQCGILLNLSKVYLAENKIIKAKEAGSAAFTCGLKNPDAYLKMETAKHLVRVYHANNEVAKAAELFAQYNDLQKEHSDIQKQKAYIKTELSYKVKHKEAENALLLAKQRESEVTIQSQKTFMSSLLIILLLSFILVAFAVRAYILKQKQNKILDKKVLVRTAELNQSYKKLEKSNKKLAQSNKELEKFAYIASHDLKQPLSTILNFSKLLSKEVENTQHSESKLYLKYILDSGKRMMNLIEDVLEYSKLNIEDQALETIDLNELVEEVKEMSESYLEKRNALIKIKDPLPIIKGDKNRMLIVFKNLIENGVKYNTSEKPTIIISNKKEGDFFKISFHDNGIGIEEQYHDKLFQMFCRLQNHHDYEGSGLGLSICKKIINSLGGKIGLENQSKQGSSFYFELPISVVISSLEQHLVLEQEEQVY